MRTSWSVMKSFADDRAVSIQYIETANKYFLKAFDGIFSIETELDKNPSDATEKNDFETNYKPYGNRKIDLLDSDGSKLSRVKSAPSGWTYQVRAVEFETSKLSSIYNKDHANADVGDTSIKFYKLVGGVETEITGGDLNQEYLDANCIKTVLGLEPLYDNEIIGGSAKILVQPTTDVRLWVVAVPDISAAYGGTKVMINGVNFKFIASGDSIDADGRSSKRLTYSATYHTNKINFVVRHDAGHKNKLMICVEHYKL